VEIARIASLLDDRLAIEELSNRQPCTSASGSVARRAVPANRRSHAGSHAHVKPSPATTTILDKGGTMTAGTTSTKNVRNARESVLIRFASTADAEAVEWVAQRDTRRVPPGPHMVAELDGRILAARSLASGEVIADPFSHTAYLVSILELHCAQVSDVGPRRRWSPGGAPAVTWASESRLMPEVP
jgi:hypothetical protein